jgi:hypothetical protein
MKCFLALLFCVAMALSATGQTAPETSTARQKESALVKAAKSSGGPKRKSTKKVITNNDVKKSKGKLVTLPPKSAPATAAPGPVKGSLEKQDDQRRAQSVATERISVAQAKVIDLEKELARLEQAYYEAADPNYRDTTIQTRFNQTKRQLDDARKELAEARDVKAKSRQ